MNTHSNPTPSGTSTTLQVGLLRGASILFTGATAALLAPALALIPSGGTLNDLEPWRWWAAAATALTAAIAAYTEITLGVSGARAQERALRASILTTYFRTTAQGKTSTPAPPPARYLALLTDSLERVTEYRQVYWGATIASIIAPLLLVLYITALDWATGLSILALIPLIPLTIWLFFRYFRKVSGNSRAERERLAVSYLDAIRQLIPIRLYGAGQRIENTLKERGEANRKAVMKLLAANQLVIIVMDAVFLVLLVCWAVFIISWRASTGALTPAEAITALVLVPLLLEPLGQVAGFFYIGMGGRASQRAVKGYLASGKLSAGHPGGRPSGHPGKHPGAHAGGRPGSQPKAPAGQHHTEAPKATPPAHSPKPHPPTPTTPPDPSAAISIRNLTHSYGHQPILTNLNLDIHPGSRLAIMGPSGIGKSTLLKLIAGALPNTPGTITIQGHTPSPQERRQATALVTQNTWLFTGTIADNLRLAKPTATDQELWDALTTAHLDHDIRALPQGLNTAVGEAGSLLSGGQAQRLSLARAILSGRTILLLDEPTAHLDPASEKKIIQALANLGNRYTLIIVTHRTSLLTLADTLLTLNPHGATLIPTTNPQEPNHA